MEYDTLRVVCTAVDEKRALCQSARKPQFFVYAWSSRLRVVYVITIKTFVQSHHLLDNHVYCVYWTVSGRH